MGKIKNLTGQKFGKLTVLEITPERRNRQVVWKCQCECGNICYVVGQALRNLHTTSCGCSRKDCKNVKNLLGQKFTKLTVLERIGSNESREALWKCQCECGQYRICSTHQLTSLEIRSCSNCINYSSKGEQIIAELLTKNGINFIREYYFKDLVSKNNYPLRFDFAIIDDEKNLIKLIEYDGGQHFKPIEQFGGQEAFEELKQRDKIKNNYCREHNINLLRISKDYRNLKIEDLI